MKLDPMECVRTGGGDPENVQLVLRESEVDVGQYWGQTFKWLLPNVKGCTTNLLLSHEVSVCNVLRSITIPLRH